MEDIVTQRVNEFRQQLSMSILAFSKVIGINQTTLNKQLKDDGCGASVSTLTRILSVYPDLSAEWLLRGEGEMMKGSQYRVTEYVPVQDTELVDALRDHIATLKESNARLLAENKELKREKNVSPVGYDFVAAEGTGDILLTKKKTKSNVNG